MTTKISIQFPKSFKGLFEAKQAKYGPLIYKAVQQIQDMPLPEDLHPFLAYQVWENPQPSFILLPFSYLAAAEASGHITDKHVQYLPIVMLLSELVAVADDTIDRTPLRSDRTTFAKHFGEASALAFVGELTTLVLTESKNCDLRLFDAAEKFLSNCFILELWERQHMFPEPVIFKKWLQHRYAMAVIGPEYGLNSALILNDNPLWPNTALDALGRIEQDVDDIVNLVEYRERHGENDDLRMGIVTRPMLYAIENNPKLAEEISELWSYYRPLAESHPSITELQQGYTALNRKTTALYKHIRTAIIAGGLPQTIEACLVDLRTSVRASPTRLKPFMRALSSAFIDRLRRCHHVKIEDLH